MTKFAFVQLMSFTYFLVHRSKHNFLIISVHRKTGKIAKRAFLGYVR